jgi:putative FmdB family regulatory protein
MPLYEYKCHGCGQTFEVLQKFSDEPLKVHEACGGETERLISPPAFQFKGSGWYVTDYAKKSGNSGGSKSGGSSDGAKAEGSKDSGGESKPAASESKSSAPASSTPESRK